MVGAEEEDTVEEASTTEADLEAAGADTAVVTETGDVLCCSVCFGFRALLGLVCFCNAWERCVCARVRRAACVHHCLCICCGQKQANTCCRLLYLLLYLQHVSIAAAVDYYIQLITYKNILARRAVGQDQHRRPCALCC